MVLIPAGDVELDYERSGSGPPLLAIMGMSGTSLATLQAETVIHRNWTWSNSSGHQMAWQDAVIYP